MENIGIDAALAKLLEKRKSLALGLSSHFQEIGLALSTGFDLLWSTISSIMELFETQKNSLTLLGIIVNKLAAGIPINSSLDLDSASCKISFSALFGSKVNVESIISILDPTIKCPPLKALLSAPIPEKSDVSSSCERWFKSLQSTLKNEVAVSLKKSPSLEDFCKIRNSLLKHVSNCMIDKKGLDNDRVQERYCDGNILITISISI